MKVLHNIYICKNFGSFFVGWSVFCALFWVRVIFAFDIFGAKAADDGNNDVGDDDDGSCVTATFQRKCLEKN